MYLLGGRGRLAPPSQILNKHLLGPPLAVGLEICLRPWETKLKQKRDIQGTFYRLKGDLKLRSNQPQNHNL